VGWTAATLDAVETSAATSQSGRRPIGGARGGRVVDGGWIGRVRERERVMRGEPLFRNESGLGCCMFLAAGLLLLSWAFGSFLYADYHCGSPECAAMRPYLDRSAVSAFVGLGCVFLSVLVDRLVGGADFAFRPGLLVAAAAGVCGLVALASFAVGASHVPDILLLLFQIPVVALVLLLFPAWVVVWKSGW
jgi:hypothetical protein